MPETKKRNARKPRVFWTREELNAVIGESVLVSIEDVDNLWRHMDVAQKRVLPAGRQRLIIGSMVATDEIKAAFKVARAAFLNRKDQVELPAATPATKPEPTPTPSPEPEHERVEQIAQQPVLDRAAIIEGITNEELFELLARRLAPILAGFGTIINLFRNQLSGPGTSPAPAKEAPTPPATPVVVPPAPPTTQTVATSAQPLVPVVARPTPPPAPPTSPPAPKLKKVVIFGFPTEIEDSVRRKAGSFHLELLFVSHELGEGTPKIPVCDWCIFNDRTRMTERINVALRARPGLDHLYKVGTAEKVLQKLADINSRRI